MSRGTGVKGIDEAVHPLSSDDMKTLLRELRQRVDANEARVTEGRMPSLHDIDACPGRELYDIWSSNAHRPRYRDEAPEWEREIISRASYR